MPGTANREIKPSPGNAAALVVLVLVMGCGVDNEGNSSKQSATIKALSAYDILKGTVKIEVEASATSRLELLVDGQSVETLSTPPHSFTWDTTSTPDGIVKLSLREHGGHGPSDEVPVVVLNKGSEAPYFKGISSGTLAAPRAGGDTPHLSFTWTMPNDGTKEVLALLFWKDSSFRMEMSMGVGCCASSGRTGAKGRGDSAPVVVTFEDTKELPLPVSIKWFVDASATNSAEVASRMTDLFVKVYLLK
jgi:hypothetical protein